MGRRLNEEEPSVHKIAVIPGDGTGPEVVAEALKVLASAAKRFDFTYETVPYDFGGERHLLPDDYFHNGCAASFECVRFAVCTAR